MLDVQIILRLVLLHGLLLKKYSLNLEMVLELRRRSTGGVSP